MAQPKIPERVKELLVEHICCRFLYGILPRKPQLFCKVPRDSTLLRKIIALTVEVPEHRHPSEGCARLQLSPGLKADDFKIVTAASLL
eukprot:CAMPEP_0170585708 /NCGR_PEP_ID=MMETSP0224-20130122/9362_1 /TAXON_ID=285029 /ORGANISM="Togula jolla, Strain CCCM 725" /LENGTH=87 /DNA_ID=CAMNT_0010909219 /DNA_START=407 /DNA_END=670 /DNA_ORIENTATION=-